MPSAIDAHYGCLHGFTHFFPISGCSAITISHPSVIIHSTAPHSACTSRPRTTQTNTRSLSLSFQAMTPSPSRLGAELSKHTMQICALPGPTASERKIWKATRFPVGRRLASETAKGVRDVPGRFFHSGEPSRTPRRFRVAVKYPMPRSQQWREISVLLPIRRFTAVFLCCFDSLAAKLENARVPMRPPTIPSLPVNK
jgi:hypothetical protein